MANQCPARKIIKFYRPNFGRNVFRTSICAELGKPERTTHSANFTGFIAPCTAAALNPSAASFLECIRRHGRFRAVPAKNDVIDGIRRVSDALKERRILFSQSCTDCLREFALYRWDNTAARDAPRKEYDHAMDDVRYFVSTVLAHEEDGFFALAMSR